MNPRRFALIGGSFMVIWGLIALLPSLSVAPMEAGLPELKVMSSYGHFLDFFPMNIFNKAAMILLGIAGILSVRREATSLPSSIRFSRIVFYVMAPLTLLGSIHATNTLGGYWPLFGGEILVHAGFAILGAYYGFTLSGKAAKELERREDLKPADERRAA